MPYSIDIDKLISDVNELKVKAMGFIDSVDNFHNLFKDESSDTTGDHDSNESNEDDKSPLIKNFTIGWTKQEETLNKLFNDTPRYQIKFVCCLS